MATTNQLAPGMILSLNEKLYRVESSLKVTVRKGAPFIKVKLKSLEDDEVIEKNFKLNQSIKDVALIERSLEFLYPEGDNFLALDIASLEQVLVPVNVVGNKINYLKEGIEFKAFFYGDAIFNIELPDYLELMVTRIDDQIATLETGAKIAIPPYIQSGDFIRVQPRNDEFIQRV